MESNNNKFNTTYNPLNHDKTLDLIEIGVNEYSIKAQKTREILNKQNNALSNLSNNVETVDNKVISVINKTKNEFQYTKMCANCGLLPIIIFLAIIILIGIFVLVFA